MNRGTDNSVISISKLKPELYSFRCRLFWAVLCSLSLSTFSSCGNQASLETTASSLSIPQNGIVEPTEGVGNKTDVKDLLETQQQANNSDLNYRKFNTNFSSLLGVSDSNAPNETLIEWLKDYNFYDASNGKLSEPDTSVFESLRNSATVDLSKFKINKDLIGAARHANKLEWLKLNGNYRTADLDWICEITNLRGLSLRGADLSGCDFEDISRLHKLQWLDLSFSRCPSRKIGKLFELPNLEVLLLGDDCIDDDQLTFVKNLPNLKALSLRNSNISDKGLAKLVELAPELKYLNISNNPKITTGSFSEILKLTKLEYLHFGNTALVGQKLESGDWAIHQFRKLLPNCEIRADD